MAAPTLTNPPVSPSVSRPATFDAEADAHLAWQATNVTEMGAVNTWIEGQTTNVTDQADIATAQAVIATTQAGIATTQAGIATAQAGISTTQAGLAAASAASAVNSPGTSATSTTSLTIGSGAQSLTIQTGKAFTVGQTIVIARTSSPTTQMTAVITDHNSGTGALSGTVAVGATSGSGTYTDWTISLSGVQGATGASAPLIPVLRTSNTILTSSDNGKYFIITSGTFTQTFDTAAALGNGWYCYVKNAGIGEITIGTYKMYAGEERRFISDGAAISSIVITPFYITAIASGTFTKPPGYSAFCGLIWGAGGSGAAARVAVQNTSGGGAASCTPIWYKSSDMPSSVSYIIGSGGAAITASAVSASDGNDGGNSTFGSFIGYGGIAGTYLSVYAPSGAGIYGKATSGVYGGAPDGNSFNFAVTGFLEFHQNSSTYGGGGGGQLTVATGTLPINGGDSVYGGAGAAGCKGDATNYTTAGVSGKSYYGATAGGGAYRNVSSTYVQPAVGTSIYGGTGGAASAGTGSRTGTAGGVRGGGGGAAVSTDNTAAVSGAGGRGELQLWGII